jgi:alkaline phosphatase D
MSLFPGRRFVSIILRLVFSLFLVVGCSSSKSIRIDSYSSIRIAFGSCVSKPDSGIWRKINEIKPDVFIFLGDNIYLPPTEIPSVEFVLQAYRKIYLREETKKLFEDSEVLAIWDDHDFGSDNSDSGYLFKNLTLKAFKKFWNMPSPPSELENSVAFRKSFGEILVLGTDNRSYRVNKGGSLKPQVFGPKQLEWLRKEIASSKAKLILLAVGGQILSTNDNQESFKHYPEEKSFILDLLAAAKMPVIIISGDRHYAEVLKIQHKGKTIWEITSSPLAAGMAPAKLIKADMKSRAIYTKTTNFGMLEIYLLGQELKVEAFIIDERGIVRAKETLY